MQSKRDNCLILSRGTKHTSLYAGINVLTDKEKIISVVSLIWIGDVKIGKYSDSKRQVPPQRFPAPSNLAVEGRRGIEWTTDRHPHVSLSPLYTHLHTHIYFFIYIILWGVSKGMYLNIFDSRLVEAHIHVNGQVTETGISGSRCFLRGTPVAT
jgi:hypothetical protein